MLITLPNADFSGTGLGKVTRMVGGMPAENLQGLWLFDEGADGDTIEGVTDRSGNNNHATPRFGWSERGIKRSYGMEVPTNKGVCYQTPIAHQRPDSKFTILVSGTDTLDGETGNLYNNWTGASDNYGMDTSAQSHSNNPAIVLNVKGETPAGSVSIFDGGGDLFDGALTAGVYGTVPPLGSPKVFGFQIDGVAGTARPFCLGADVSPGITTPELQAYYDGVTDLGTFEFGPWPHSAWRSTNDIIANVYAVAFYDGFMDHETSQTHMQYMADIAAKRGVTGW